MHKGPTDRQTDRKTDRQTQPQIDKYIYRQINCILYLNINLIDCDFNFLLTVMYTLTEKHAYSQCNARKQTRAVSKKNKNKNIIVSTHYTNCSSHAHAYKGIVLNYNAL